MRKIFLPYALLLPIICASQTLDRNALTHSREVQVYKVSALQAEKFIQTDSIPVDNFITPKPDYTFGIDTAYNAKLPTGNYVFIYTEDNKIVADLINKTNLFIYTINNGKRVQIEVRDANENFITNAKVWAEKKQARYNADSRNYIVKQKKPDEVFIKVYTPADTAFTELESKDDQYSSVSEQRWRNINNSRVIRTVKWLPAKVSKLFGNKSSYNYNSTPGKGYTLFNQPKYKLSDTVKLKAFIVTKNGRPFRKSLDLFLMKYENSDQKQLLHKITPVSPGSYLYSFPLSDTLNTDMTYTLAFETKKEKKIMSGKFKIEDYLPDDITEYNVRSDKDEYSGSDSIKIFVSAKDANGLSLLDGKARIILTTGNPGEIFKDSLYISDTLYTETKPLATEGETLFSLSSYIFKYFSGEINAEIIFTNSNQETQTREINFNYNASPSFMKTKIEGDTLYADYYSSIKTNDIIKGELIISRDTDKIKAFDFPLRMKIDPFAYNYKIFLLKNNIIIDSSLAGLDNSYTIKLERISKGDTLGFVLKNPYKINVNYTVFDGNKIIANGKSGEAKIQWQQLQHNKRRMLRVKWQYYWNAEEKTDEQRIALLYKLLKLDVASATQVYPGQKDSIEINVKNYKGKPASGVNLAAVSYNSQLAKDIKVKEPPYLQHYRVQPFITRNGYDYWDATIRKKYPLGKHIGWLHKLGIDTMQHYQMLFPEKGVADYITPVHDFLPQVSVHVTRNGERQEIYMLYINRNLVYYNGVTDSMQYAFPSTEGYTQIAIRLRDSLITIDSIYTQPFYKHDIIIDPDKLTGKVKREARPAYLNSYERLWLEKSLWQLDNNGATNFSYIWQGWRLVHITGYRKHITGPFIIGDSMHFFAPAKFDTHFRFEFGYEYNLSEKILRLEKKPVFPDNIKEVPLLPVKEPAWILGDTLMRHPEISYPKIVSDEIYLKKTETDFHYLNAHSGGNVGIINKSDSTWKYIVFHQQKDTAYWLVIELYSSGIVYNIDPGIYDLLLITKKGFTTQLSIEIKKGQTLYLNSSGFIYTKDNALLKVLLDKQKEEAVKYFESRNPKQTESDIKTIPDSLVLYGNSSVKGYVKDIRGGLPVPFVTVMIEGTRIATATRIDGSYNFKELKDGTYRITAAAIGYISETKTIQMRDGNSQDLNFELTPSSNKLADVVVTTALGVSRSTRNLGYATTVIRGDELTQTVQPPIALIGKAAGVNISGDESAVPSSIKIRGVPSFRGSSSLLFIIDGILYDELPANISPDMIVSTEVLKGAEAIAVYGPKAADGAIVITTKNKTSRTIFRDYAFWQPELITDKNGKVKFEITYPDNINGWQTYVLAMDRHKRIGKSVTFTASYKPVMAQLSMPRFLIEGDSTILTGKLLNYTSDNYSLKTFFTINNAQASSTSINLTAKSSSVMQLPISANAGTDSISAGFSLNTTTGFKDGEEKKIPVLRKGIEETTGIFAIMNRDTSFTYSLPSGSDEVVLYAENKTLDIMLDELEYLKKYPWFCTEQTSSKLKGLLMEKNIRQQLNEKFNDNKDIKVLTEKLIKSQAFDGGWGWWQDSKQNIFITGYVLQSLMPLRNDKSVENALRNGFLFLQNNLGKCNRNELLNSLAVLSSAGHVMDYKPWLDKLNFDSLSTYQRWQYVFIKQSLAMDHEKELGQLYQSGVPTMTGGLYWGNENYSWYSNIAATTVTAYKVLSNEKKYQDALPRIQQYLLESRQHGHWHNTAESALILDAIIPSLLKTNNSFAEAGSLRISGDTSFIIDSFPFKLKLDPERFKKIQVTKEGGGLTYFTLYNHQWNTNPAPETDKFNIQTYFPKNKQSINTIPYGEKIEIAADIDVKADAEFVMIEIPIPAGCTYAIKPQVSYDMHYEYLKDRIIIFAESLKKGNHHFTAELEARYAGTYTLNPAKAELMYFPTFYGRNELKKVKIE